MRKAYRVYNTKYTPREGYKDFFDVKTKTAAIKLTSKLNKTANKKKGYWGWA